MAPNLKRALPDIPADLYHDQRSGVRSADETMAQLARLGEALEWCRAHAMTISFAIDDDISLCAITCPNGERVIRGYFLEAVEEMRTTLRREPGVGEPLCEHGFIGACAECDGMGQDPRS